MIQELRYIKLLRKVSAHIADPYLAHIVATCYLLSCKSNYVGHEIKTFVNESNIYQHIINSCVNRQRVLDDPNAELIVHSMPPEVFRLKTIKELKRKKDYESKELYRFATQSFGHRDL